MYCAYITTLKGLRKHSNADRLQCRSIWTECNCRFELSGRTESSLLSI